METIIFHIDVNSAFLSWSALDKLHKDPSLDLRTVPSVIGGDQKKRHGVVFAKSIPAKAYHIQTGEPIINALKKCPNLIIEPPNMAIYSEKSHQLMNFLSDICPDIEQVSIDECFMDFTSISSFYPSPEEAANTIKDSIFYTFGFTVNIGISNRKVLAKMASDFKKPNLVHTLYDYEIQNKMWPLPVDNLFMCGKSSIDTLHKLEILTIGDLAKADPDILVSHLKSHGRLLWEYANGIDNSSINPEPLKAKGIGNSITLVNDASTKEAVYKVLLNLSETVSRRLRLASQNASMVSIEIKYNTFQTVSHQTTLQKPTSTSGEIYKNACALFNEIWDQTPIRLLGIRTSKLLSIDEPIQLSLFDLEKNHVQDQKLEKLEHAIDDIKKRFGDSSITRGSFLLHENDYKKH